MFHIVLVEPEIPPNTGNIIRLCVNTGAHLSLIEPLGFDLQHKSISRSAMDYYSCLQQQAHIEVHRDFQALLDKYQPARLFAATTKARQLYTEVDYQPGDFLVFGPESRGLDQDLLRLLPDHSKIRIPMCSTGRSLNLANAVAIITYEAWRQQQFGQAIRTA